MHEILKPYYFMSRGISCNGIEVYKLMKYRTNLFHVAYHRAGESRWRISAPMSENLADVLMSVANEEIYRGSTKLTTLRHRLRIYAVESNPSRWKKHRKAVADRAETRQLANLNNFGMF